MGKIKGVTNANVAEYVNERKALGSEVKTEEQVKQVDKAIAGQPVKAAEPVAPAPNTEPVVKKNSVQERIDELTRKAKEADEFAEDTYGQLTSSQRRIKELEAQLQVNNPPPKVEKKPEPKPTDVIYKKADGTVDQDKFLTDWGKWNRDTAIEEFEAKRSEELQKAETKRLFDEAEARRASSIAAAQKEYPDFDEKILEASKSVEMNRTPAPNKNVEALLYESEFAGHILYYLTQHPEKVTEWNKMRPVNIALAIGRLETTFTKPVEANPSTDKPLKPNLPEPTPSLGAGGGAIPVDISGPMDFRAYKQKRMDELAKNRKR